MGFTTVCLQFTLASFNLLFWLCGIALVGVGIWFLVDPAILSYLDIASVNENGDLALAIAIVTLTVGGIMFLVSFFGFFGACVASTCMLYTYATLVFIVVVLQLTAGVMAIVHNTWLGEQLESGMNTFLEQEYDGGDTSLSQSWDSTQVHMKCCGVSGKSDYVDLNTFWYREVSTDNWEWPLTCCVLKNSDPNDPEPEDRDGCFLGLEGTVHETGCYDELSSWLETWGWAIAASLLCLMVLQIMIAACACCLVDHIKRDQFVPVV